MHAKRKENAMKTTKTNATGKRNDTHAKASPEWLMAKGRSGEPRIRRLTWSRLGRIYRSKAATRATRRLIEREARRCGYSPATVFGTH
jgi:hypothetical protein